MRYEVYEPKRPLSDVVDYLWWLSDAPVHARERIVPTGTIELVINLAENEFRIYRADASAELSHRLPGAIVSGCYGAPFGIDTREHASILGVRFKPGSAAGVLGLPPGILADTHVALEDIWGGRAVELRERVGATADSGARFRLLEHALVERLLAAPSRRNRTCVKTALQELERVRVGVGDVARALGLSRRRFIEVFSEDVGMTPKLYARVRRFQRALTRATTRPPTWSELAHECGYFDQAHLCREWSELTGVSPAEFVALRSIPVKDGHIAMPREGVKSIQDASALRP
jgi:AraC-like DNA-binding protein